MNIKGEEIPLGKEMEKTGNLYFATRREQFGSNAPGVTFHDRCVQFYGSNFMCTGCVNESDNSASSCDKAPQNDWNWYKIMFVLFYQLNKLTMWF